MIQKTSNHRIYSSLLALGAGVLLFRTIRMMLVEGAFDILVPWVIILLIAEFLVDLTCLVLSFRWLIIGTKEVAVLPLRFGATAAILHAFRVLIYVLGRTGPWVNFDVKPEYHASYTFEWFWVYFASPLSILGIIGVIIIWWIRRKRIQDAEKKPNNELLKCGWSMMRIHSNFYYKALCDSKRSR